MIEGLVGIVELFIYWRATLCLVVGAVAAFLLVQIFPWISVLQGLALGFLGFIPGVAWEYIAADRQLPAANATRPTSIGVVVASGVLTGAAWGAVSATSLHAFIAGAIIFLVVFAITFTFSRGGSSWSRRGSLRVSFAFAALTYPLSALLVHQALWRGPS